MSMSFECFPKLRLTQWTLIARKLALGAGTVVRVPAYTADVVVGHVPAPCSDGVPFSYRDLHRWQLQLIWWGVELARRKR